MSNKNFVIRNGITVGSWNLVDEFGNLNASTLNLSSGFNSLNVVTFTANTIVANNFGNITANTITANNFGNVTANSYSYSDGTGPGFKFLLDDISNLFDGFSTTFNLTVNGTPVIPDYVTQLDIRLGNLPVLPSFYGTDYYSLSLFDVSLMRQNYPGYTVSGSTITFPNPPAQGMSFQGTMLNNNDNITPFTLKVAPFSGLNIMFSY